MKAMRLLSPRELAEALGVSESSLKRWVDAGRIRATKTEGGHRRIALGEAVRFVRETGAPVVRPDLLDMPEVAVAHERSLRGGDQLLDLLIEGNAVGARGWLLARYLEGTSLASLCDGPVKHAMHTLGELWKHDEGGVFIEHRGTDVALQALAHLRSTFEPYILPSFMAPAVGSAPGRRARNLGPDTPVTALQHATIAHKPRLIWISASAPMPASQARALGAWAKSLPPSITIVCGGRASDAVAEAGIRRLESMSELMSVAASVSA